ncbi:MFS transporter [Cryptosporangium phraense]|uniref:MFS transporter n=1 Tax=Cryptosporangium phraense TaxID=2593070 RepID=A0A545ANR1_9ACTN|nr:MFS transporter [Cryptosporangium phraense]TQS42957.1 MFS transporter [Cryptosporangium phraense]
MRELWPASGPERALTLATLVSSFGFAAFVTASGLFFVRFVHLDPKVVGAGLAVAGVVALAGPLLFGRLCDSIDPRTLTLWLFVVQAVLLVGYAFVRSAPMFVVVLTAVTFVDRGCWVARSVLVSRVAGSDGRVRFKAQQRAVFNTGAALGALAAAVPLQLDTRPAYLALLGAYVVSCAVAAVCVAAIPRSAGASPGSPGWVAVRDPAYLASSLLSGLLMLHHSLLVIALPLWIVRSTSAPAALVGVLVALNTVLAVVLQVRLSGGAESVPGAARAGRLGALVLVPACLLLGSAASAGAAIAVALLVAGVVLLTLGELWTGAASWGLSYGLAPDALMGQYQGVFSLGVSVEGIVGPILATSVVLGWGMPGWAIVGGIFLVLGLLIGPVARWGSRTRAEEIVVAAE